MRAMFEMGHTHTLYVQFRQQRKVQVSQNCGERDCSSVHLPLCAFREDVGEITLFGELWVVEGEVRGW